PYNHNEERSAMKFALPTTLTVALATCVVAPATAQTGDANFPNRPLRIIVPLAAGGAIDTIARGMSPLLAAKFGQPVVVENRSGAAETIGTELTARATPDGYTMLMASASFVVSPQLFTVRYNVLKDF